MEQLSRIFGTSLEEVTSSGPHGHDVTHRHRTGALQIPAELDGVVTAVLGLDDRPQARTQFRAIPLAAAPTSYTPPELARIYSFPAGTDGTGQSVAIIELGGGFAQSDLDSYFSGLGITGPTVRAVGVDGAANRPGQDPQGGDGEVLLDIEVVGALVPRADVAAISHPTPTPASSTPSSTPPMQPRHRRRSASAGARMRTNGPPRPGRRSTRPWPTPLHSA